MKIFFVSLGCDKNLVDSEEMLALLEKRGYSFTDDETQADVIIINTAVLSMTQKKRVFRQSLKCLSTKKKTVRL